MTSAGWEPDENRRVIWWWLRWLSNYTERKWTELNPAYLHFQRSTIIKWNKSGRNFITISINCVSKDIKKILNPLPWGQFGSWKIVVFLHIKQEFISAATVYLRRTEETVTNFFRWDGDKWSSQLDNAQNLQKKEDKTVPPGFSCEPTNHQQKRPRFPERWWQQQAPEMENGRDNPEGWMETEIPSNTGEATHTGYTGIEKVRRPVMGGQRG